MGAAGLAVAKRRGVLTPHVRIEVTVCAEGDTCTARLDCAYSVLGGDLPGVLYVDRRMRLLYQAFENAFTQTEVPYRLTRLKRLTTGTVPAIL